MPDFLALAQDIQNRASYHVPCQSGKDVLAIKKARELRERDSLLPEGGCPKHLHGEVRSLLLQRSIAFPTLYGVLVYWICNLRPTLLN
jgi:hypothetical protein